MRDRKSERAHYQVVCAPIMSRPRGFCDFQWLTNSVAPCAMWRWGLLANPSLFLAVILRRAGPSSGAFLGREPILGSPFASWMGSGGLVPARDLRFVCVYYRARSVMSSSPCVCLCSGAVRKGPQTTTQARKQASTLADWHQDHGPYFLPHFSVLPIKNTPRHHAVIGHLGLAWPSSPGSMR